MKILVLNGSPKKKSDTMVMTNAFLRGLQSINEQEITMINVIDQNIAPCHGCFGCMTQKNGRCIIDDDQNRILEMFPHMDVVIWSFPLYCYGMPGHLKTVLDRTIPLTQMKMVEVDGRTRHIPLMDFSKLHTVIITGCGFPNYEHNFEALTRQCELCFRNLTLICVPEAPLFNVSAADMVTKPKIAAFEQAGETYARQLSLPQGTINALQSLMIPKEDYIRNVNG